MFSKYRRGIFGSRPMRFATIAVVGFALSRVDDTACHGQGLIDRLQARRAARRAALAAPPIAAPPIAAPPIVVRPVAPATPIAPTSRYPRAAETPRTTTRSSASTFAPPSRRDAGGSSAMATPSDFDDDAEYGQSLLEREDDSDLALRVPGDSPDAATMGIDVMQQAGAVRVTGFRPHSLATEAGVEIGDAIVAINGFRVVRIADAADVIARSRPGQIAVLMIDRDGSKTVARVPLVAAAVPPANQTAMKPPTPAVLDSPQAAAPVAANSLGFTAENIAGVRGVRVTAIDPQTAASQSDLKIGDRLVSIDGRLVADSLGLSTALARQRSDDPITVRVIRDNQVFQFRMPSKFDVAADSPAPQSDDNSITSGLGSMLGGFFGGGSPKSQPPPEPTPQPEVNDLPPPRPDSIPMIDTLDFGDEVLPSVPQS